MADPGASSGRGGSPGDRRSAAGARHVGQVIYHLLSAAHATRAPWPVVVLVSCLPVFTLGFGAALTHLLRDGGGGRGRARGCVYPRARRRRRGTVAATVPGPLTDAVPTPPVSEVGQTVARRGRRRPGNAHARKAERKYAADLAEGKLPSLRAVMRDLGIGQPTARRVLAHLTAKLPQAEET